MIDRENDIMNATRILHWTNFRKHHVRLGTATLLTTLLSASLSGASIPNASGQIILCYLSSVTCYPDDWGFLHGPAAMQAIDEDAGDVCRGGLRLVVNQKGVPGPKGPQGPTGAQGPAGPQGLPGKSAIGQIFKRTTTGALGTNAGDSVQMQLGCNAGEMLLSGGYYSSNPAAPYSVQESYLGDDNMWHLYIISNKALTANITLSISCGSP